MSTSDLFPETLLVSREGERIYTTSRRVAWHFGKRHTHVLRTIKQVIAELDDAAFSEPNFGLTEYPDARGKMHPEYHLSHDGFMFLTMGFTGREAMRWRKTFIAAFRQQEAELAALQARYVAALDQIRPYLRPVVADAELGLRRCHTAEELGKSPASITYYRRQARRFGLLPVAQHGAAA